MKICRFLKGDIERWGVVEDGAVFELEKGPFDQDPSGGLKRTGDGCRLEDVRLLAPSAPSKIVAIGLNYKAHAAEFHKPLPEEP
ncbi:MAG: Rv2993c-like domain-containing protein, partial [Deltaproteobacteria bacterium]